MKMMAIFSFYVKIEILAGNPVLRYPQVFGIRRQMLRKVGKLENNWMLSTEQVKCP